MKSGISTKIRYNINDNVVVCTITREEWSPLDWYIFNMANAARSAELSTPKELSPSDWGIPQEFKGIARLKDGDEHNLALAKEIARKKAMRKMYRTYHNYVKLAAEYFGMAWGRYLDLAIELADKANDIDDEIVELTSGKSQS